MRLEEIAAGIAYASGGVQAAFAELRKLEERAAELKTESAKEQRKLDALLELQGRLIETSRLTEFGLPPWMTPEDFARITGHKITS
jgi:hypothetical protein